MGVICAELTLAQIRGTMGGEDLKVFAESGESGGAVTAQHKVRPSTCSVSERNSVRLQTKG